MFHFSKLFKKINFQNFSLTNFLEHKDLTLIGWVKSINKLKNRTFINLHDGRSLENIQIVLLGNDILRKGIRRGSCIKVFGELVPSIGPNQNKELIAKSLDLLSNENDLFNIDDSNNKLFDSKNTGLKAEVARSELLHLRHRIDYYSAIGRIRAHTKQSIRDYMTENHYLEVDTPFLTKIDCEGAGEAFCVTTDSHGNKENITFVTKLTVSAQLHLEALALGYGKVYTLSPVFRANKSKTRFHLAEFLMLEVESVEISNVDQLCNEIELLIKSVFNRFIDFQNSNNNLDFIQKSNLVNTNENMIDRLKRVCRTPQFIRISFSEAVELLKADGIISKENNDPNSFSKAEEQHLLRLLGNDKIPVFVTEFPACHKPFYCKLSMSDTSTAMAADLLLPSVGEVVGASVREDNFELMKERIRSAGLDEGNMGWYLNLRSTGGCPHAGFGLGFDRLIQFMTGINNIQDVVTFPRLYDTCTL